MSTHRTPALILRTAEPLTYTWGMGIVPVNFPHSPMRTPQKEKAYIALKKAGSLLQKVLMMVEEDAYCIDVMQQNLAVIGLLKSAHQSLMEGHLDSCVQTALDTGSPAKKKKMIEEILTVSRLAGK